MFFLSIFACSHSLSDTADFSPTKIDILQAQLSGRFTSEEQATQDPDYFNIQLHSCSVQAPDLGKHVLYVEQAQTETPTDPYRQRLYVLEETSESDENFTARSTIYSLKNTSWPIGLCNEEITASYTIQDVTLREGCHVDLVWNGSGFNGSTEGKNCSSSLGEATYATSEVTTSPNTIESWDRGFNDSDVQVWGATNGAYRFLRQN